MKIGEKLKLIAERKPTAMGSLESLSENSSSIAAALKVCRCVGNESAKEMVARTFLNVYLAGFVGGVDHAKTGK